MSPVKLLDLDRKEELILGKQLRQSSTKMLRRNLPTLIEASPDFNQKKLPYLPNLPPSVQVPGDTGSSLHSWFESKRLDNTDIGPIYSMPNKHKNNRRERSERRQSPENRPDSRRSRSSSITFDLDPDLSPRSNKARREKDKEKEEKRERREKKERQERRERREREEKEERRERKEREERRLRKEKEGKESQAAVFAQENIKTLQRNENKIHDTIAEEEYSMWSCRRCTLENRLEQSICGACGGSRLSSIGEVHLDNIQEDAVYNAVQENAIYNVHEKAGKQKGQLIEDIDWSCEMCTLKNPVTADNCEACNTANPLRLAKVERQHLVHEHLPIAARYIGLALLTLLLAYFLVRVLICGGLYAAETLTNFYIKSYDMFESSLHFEPLTLQKSIKDFDWFSSSSSFQYFGLNFVLYGLFVPTFMYIITRYM
ncbi:uncharacterized protein LOC111707043 [Eurytemora carolleeae]|uniref:uncharacterized protein LOC111707043 n=1 Tax=Eurytemora carolleeae TaxID=1294199 RepID=UPI000C777EDF|nr:uncharacterized protein LOC111707043 [Eurytemora carolleeae]|eukprot:XP_023335804.1 uncharacterized protein LOC111707043 [Eurytemora affinis]